MDDARALLNSLMGDTRNATKDERKKSKTGEVFRDKSVCKYHLVGFCPENEHLFHNTKRDLGNCPMTHFQVSKDEYDNHPEKARFTIEYEELLFKHLQDHVRRGDDWAVKERQKNEAASAKAMDEGGNECARQEIAKLKDMSSKLIEEAESLAGGGQIEESKAKLELSDQLILKADDWSSKTKGIPEVCDICGLTKENNSGGDKANKFQHEMGKVHQGFVLIRKWHADLRKKLSEQEGSKMPASEKSASPSPSRTIEAGRKRKDRDIASQGDTTRDNRDDRYRDRDRRNGEKVSDETDRKADRPRDRVSGRRRSDDREVMDSGGGRSDRRDDEGRRRREEDHGEDTRNRKRAYDTDRGGGRRR